SGWTYFIFIWLFCCDRYFYCLL
ncbi:uncharacterized protein METZ01_LOCUS220393, partial [marine metagenome]